MILTVMLEGISKAATILSALMKVYTIPCHDRGHISVMFVLQSCTDPLHIVPRLSSQTNATSDGVCNFRNREVEGDLGVIEETFVVIHEEVDRSTTQEEFPGDRTFRNTKSEPDEVSCVCICLV